MADDPQPSSATTLSDSPNPYLSRPASSSTTAPCSSNSSKSTAAATAASKHETRLYIGNLHPSVDEYALIQMFSRFGKISKLDFLFHKSGPQRGQPRGYAFLEYASPQEALQAVVGAHEKTLRGRKISVTFATKNNADADRDAAGGVGPHRRDRRTGGESEATKTTQLSLTKNAKQPQGMDAKIAAMEAKLAKMRQAKAPAATCAAPSIGSSLGRGHASLPAKPNFKPTDSARPQQRRS
ncbi:uncharacterized protein UTRI_05142_B [Ustilago trichophora]|uniref:Probable RNA-binding protein 18 n=1 Tax=Ustilago trichophora TaxID=86804 RepID=A0A5C3EEE3_9BASI|nr:uncharacterized protein UTRI_05142_B [Ustilago trichophora]